MGNDAIAQSLEFNFSDTTQLISFLQHFGVTAMVNWKTLSKQVSGNFNIRQLVKTFPGKFDFWELSANPYIRWDSALIAEYYNDISWHRLSGNKGLQFSDPKLLENYGSDFKWDELSENPSFPHNIDWVTKYQSKINWVKLGSQLEAFIVYAGMDDWLSNEEMKRAETDLKLLLHFKHKWNYKRGWDGYKGQSWQVNNSIFDNKKIEWKDKHIRSHFIKEIDEFNAAYKTCI